MKSLSHVRIGFVRFKYSRSVLTTHSVHFFGYGESTKTGCGLPSFDVLINSVILILTKLFNRIMLETLQRDKVCDL